MDDQVLACLAASLSPDEATRRHAEDQLKQLFLVHAGVLLQKYISRHWSAAAYPDYEPPQTPFDIKAQVRPIIFQGLSDPQPKIRNASAFALSTIARFDWPDEYPELLSQLVHLITTGSPDAIHGSMRVISEFVRNDLSEDQLLPVMQDLLPAVLDVFLNELHGSMTRALTITVFRQIIKMLETVREQYPQTVKQALEQIGKAWFDAFKQLLGTDVAEGARKSPESLEIRVQIFRTLSTFQSAFPRSIASDLVGYIHLAVQNMVSLSSLFLAYQISSHSDAPDRPSTDDGDSLGPKVDDINDLGCAVFDFLTPVVRTSKAGPSLAVGSKGEEFATDIMQDVVRIVLEYTQITSAKEEEWDDDPNNFVVDEDGESEQYGLRLVGQDLVGSLIDRWPRAVARTLNILVRESVNESSIARQSGNANWWRPLESSLALLGAVADDIRAVLKEDAIQRREPTFDLTYLFDPLVPGLLNSTDTPFLQGRAFLFASQFASSLPPAAVERYLGAAVNALQSNSISVLVKLSAVKTIKNLCRFIDIAVMKRQSRHMLDLLLPVLSEANNETLYLILETIHAVLNVDKDLLSAQTTPDFAERVFAVWLDCNEDPVLTAIVEEIFGAISGLPSQAVVSTLVTCISPKLGGLISAPLTDNTVHLPGEAIQLVNAMLQPRGGPLEPELIATVTTGVLAILQTTDDMDVIQHGMIHLTLIVRKDCDKLVQWRDQHGNNGIAVIFDLLGRFLAPTFSESGGIFVGELIMHLFRKASHAMAPVLPDLLRAIVQRLTTAELPSFVQSMILPFGYLFGTEHTQSTIDLLSQYSVQMPDGTKKLALDLILSAWCETSETITGSWNIRVSALGLAKLFMLPSIQLRDVIVKGDLIISDANRDTIMTRSRTKVSPNRHTRIPFPVKALKLILKDVQLQEGGKGKGRAKGTATADDLDIDEDDGDEEWDDDDPLGDVDAVGEFDYLSSWLDAGGPDSDAQDDDEDLKSDPIAQIDLGQHLLDVLRRCYASNVNGMHEMIEGLSEVEKGILRWALTL